LVDGKASPKPSGPFRKQFPRTPIRVVATPSSIWSGVARLQGWSGAYSNFDIAAYLTEIIFAGLRGVARPAKLEWDGPKMHAKTPPEAAHFIKREYRKGWSL